MSGFSITTDMLDAAESAFRDGLHHDLGLRATVERALRAALADHFCEDAFFSHHLSEARRGD